MGSTIQRTENYYRRLGTRNVGANGMTIFDENDDRVQAYYSNEGPINISRAMKDNIPNATVTFNRNIQDLSGSGVNQYSTTFTTNELLNFADSKWKEMRVTVPDGKGGSKTYVLTAGPNFDREKFKSMIMGRQNTLNKNAENSYTKALEEYSKTMSPKAAALNARYIAGGQMDRALQKIMKEGYKSGKSTTKFDLTYKTINNPNTPVNRSGTGTEEAPKASKLRLPSNLPKTDTTPQPKSKSKSTSTKKKRK